MKVVSFFHSFFFANDSRRGLLIDRRQQQDLCVPQDALFHYYKQYDKNKSIVVNRRNERLSVVVAVVGSSRLGCDARGA